MKNKLTLLCLAMMTASVPAYASPAVSFEKGMVQLDISGWNTEGNYSKLDQYQKELPTLRAVIDSEHSYTNSTKFNNDSWNLSGGVTYGLSDKWALQYQYAKMSAESSLPYDHSYFLQGNLSGKEQLNGYSHELNVLYSINNYAAVYGGIKRIHTSLKFKDISSDYNYTPDLSGAYLGQTNNIIHMGLTGRYPLSEKSNIYGKIGFGAQDTTEAELGMSSQVSSDLDINVGYRYLKTQGNNGAVIFSDDDYSQNIISPARNAGRDVTFRGFTLGLSYRFNQ